MRRRCRLVTGILATLVLVTLGVFIARSQGTRAAYWTLHSVVSPDSR